MVYAVSAHNNLDSLRLIFYIPFNTFPSPINNVHILNQVWEFNFILFFNLRII
jgi:hypothetical protein